MNLSTEFNILDLLQFEVNLYDKITYLEPSNIEHSRICVYVSFYISVNMLLRNKLYKINSNLLLPNQDS